MHKTNLKTPPTIAGAGFVALDLLLENVQNWQVRRRAGGTCGNVLAILSFLGYNSVPIVRLGTDKAADILISDLELVGVDCTHIQRDPTARTARVVEFIPNGSRSTHRFAFNCPMCHRSFPRRSEPIYEQAIVSLRQANPDLFFFDRAGSSIVRLASEARTSGALVMFEPDSFKNSDLFNAALQLSDIVKYSRRRVGQSIEPWLERISSKPRLVVETMDGGGLRYMIRDRGQDGATWANQEPFPVDNPVDQAGAGDWCSAGLISRVLGNGAPNRWHKRTISRALAFGQALAAAKIRFTGPRGYLENTSPQLIYRAALSTLRLGRIPAWISQNRVLPSRLVKEGRKDACDLCLAPLGSKK